jgi:serine protease Do
MRSGAIGALILLTFAPSPAFPQAQEDLRRVRPGRVLREPVEVQARIEGILKRTRPAVVQIQQKEDSQGFSGAIVTEDGYVATCAHHFFQPGAEVTVSLVDGRKVAAEVLGSHRYWDIGLMKIKGGGKWPWVEFGKSAALRRDDLCIALGYPALKNRSGEPREMKVRLGRVVYSAATGTLQTSCLISGGDSGGPLLDLDGRLIGIHRGVGSINFAGTMHSGAELFQDVWDELAAGKRVELVPRGLGPFGDSIRALVADEPQISLDVLCDGLPTLLGTIVDPDGWILTKASDLAGRITCRLADGREFEATRHGTSRPHDLAMLKIDARGLPTIRWSLRKPPPVGTLVVAPGCRTRWTLLVGDKSVFPVATKVAAGEGSAPSGVVSHPRRKIPAMKGFPFFDVKEGEGGLQVTKVPRESVETTSPMQVGDLLIRIAGKPVPDIKAFEKALGENDVAGDRVTITLRRDGRELELSVINGPSRDASVGSLHLLSHRRTGFPDVFSTDLDLSPQMCGGPLLDLEGRVAGLNIARVSEIESYAIPAEVVRGAIPSMKSGDGAIKP